MRPEPAEIAGSARWHLYDIDPASAAASLLRLDESHYRQASFLDQRVLGRSRDRAALAFDELAEALTMARPTPAPRYIFHVGHCGSTLLSRALDASIGTLPLREPLTLRRLATVDAARRAPLLSVVVQAHARAFRAGQVAVIKATSTCNALIGPLLSARSDSRAILVYVDLETLLAGLLGKQSPALDLDGHLATRLNDWSRIDGAPPLEAGQLDETQRAVLAWLTGMRHLLAASEDFRDRARLVDFEQFLADPERELAAIAGWLGVGGDSDELLAAWPDVSTGYSKKPDEPYSAFNRRRTLLRGRSTRGDDIGRGLRWAETLVREVPGLARCAGHLGRRAD